MSLIRVERFARDRRSVTAFDYTIVAAALGIVMSTIFIHFSSKLGTLLAKTGPAFVR